MKIGVIGGNGVAATNRLCDMIERKVTAAGAFRDAHHPEMIVWQATSVPSRSMFLEGRGPDWRPDYIRIAAALKSLGCEIGCMCCNTAHYAVGEISDKSGLRFIDLLEEVALRTKELGLTRVEIFCSDGARKFDLYGNAFRRVCPEIEVVYPSADRQKMVTEVICAVKTAKRFLALDQGHPLAILKKLVSDASAPVILGCTDLRVAYSNDANAACDGVVVDSLECLADAIVRLSKLV